MTSNHTTIGYTGNAPTQETTGSAGFDLKADFTDEAGVLLVPGSHALIPTGTWLEIPEGYAGYITPRSGMALRDGVTVLNAPGTIDSDYRGEVGVVLINLGKSAVYIKHGMRIAQIVFQPVAPNVNLVELEAVSKTSRGSGGFGSTGGI